jgi:hypothetical protein
MPFVPFAPADFDRTRTTIPPLERWNASDDDLRLAGTFDGLVDLLLDLSASESAEEPPPDGRSSVNRRVRPVSILGAALMRMKRKLATQRDESLQRLNMA